MIKFDLCYNEKFHTLKIDKFEQSFDYTIKRFEKYLGTKDFLLGNITIADF